MTLKAVVFDMDGVLVDSEYTYMESKLDILHDAGYDKQEDYLYQFMGTTREYMWQTMKEQLGLSEPIDTYIADMDQRRAKIIARDGNLPIPDAVEAVKKLHEAGIPLAVASSTEKEGILRVLDALGITQYFDYIVSGEEVENSKPAPDVYLKAVGKLGLKPEECLAAEDSNNGVHAAHNAGLYTVAYINPRYPAPDLSVTQDSYGSFDEFLEKFLPLFGLSE